jgi:cytochrome c oxidase subunit 1
MPRRYHVYDPQFQVLHVASSIGAAVLGIGYLLPLTYLLYSLRYGKPAGPNPWGATGLEWSVPSPPPKDNFAEIPLVDTEPYCYPVEPDAPHEGAKTSPEATHG